VDQSNFQLLKDISAVGRAMKLNGVEKIFSVFTLSCDGFAIGIRCFVLSFLPSTAEWPLRSIFIIVFDGCDADVISSCYVQSVL